MDELAKLDQIRERVNVTYKEAKEALEQADGDVIQAIINLEEREKDWDTGFHEHGERVFTQIKELFKKGNVTKIRLKKEDQTIIEIPATLGALGIVGAFASTELALLAGLGTVTALAKKYKLEVVRPDGTTEEHPLGMNAEEV